MNTLNTIQGLFKAGKILSRIVYIVSIIGFCCSILGIICLAFGADVIRIGGLDLESILRKEADISIGTVYAAMAVGIVLFAGKALVSGFSMDYFAHETEEGTPFSMEGAGELMRLGIIVIVIPILAQIIAEISHSVISRLIDDVMPFSLRGPSDTAIGIMFIILSLVCRYGAELNEHNS